MKEIKVCIFDLDGTLLDTLDGVTYYINSVFSDKGIEPITRDMTESFLGCGARNLISRACASRGVSDSSLIDAVFEEYNRRYNSDPYYLVRPYDGIPELISALRERGTRLAVLSNKPDFATKKMIEHFFGEGFDCVVGGSESYPLKPAPDAAIAILDSLGAAPSECAFIGDAETDIETAQNLGAALSLTVLWGFRTREHLLSAGAKVLISSPGEILKHIDSY